MENKNFMEDQLQLTADLIQKFDIPVPRYTSYPMVPFWTDKYTITDHIKHLELASHANEPLSLYIHIPFCIRRCFFCACNVQITTNPQTPEKYLISLEKEIKTVAKHLEPRAKVSQLHFGGGTPTHLTPSQLDRLMNILEEHFDFLPDAEQSIEVHPSVTTPEHLEILAKHRFTRLSVGIQDFDPYVQEKINRFQTYDVTANLFQKARELDFISINGDLIYGLPYQTHEGFNNTLQKILDIRPDRLAIYSYAHLPKQIKHQAIFPIDVIPTGNDKLDLFLKAREFLLDNDYKQVGFDHFSLPSDDLWQSYTNGTLQRNFMGYTTHAGTDLVAMGYSAISDVAGSYAQNSKSLPEYHNMIEKYGLATVRGLALSEQDLLHKQIIETWMCQYFIDLEDLSKFYQKVQNTDIFDIILKKMESCEQNQLVVRNGHRWDATPLGRVFARVVASNFDTYLPHSTNMQIYSKAI